MIARLTTGDGLEKLVGTPHLMADPITPLDKGEELAKPRQMGGP